MQSRNQLYGEQLAEKIINTVRLHLQDFEDTQLDQLIHLLETEYKERQIGNQLGELGNDSLGTEL